MMKADKGQRFKDKANEVFNKRIGASGAIVVSHSMAVIRSMCSKAAVLENGNLMTVGQKLRVPTLAHY